MRVKMRPLVFPCFSYGYILNVYRNCRYVRKAQFNGHNGTKQDTGISGCECFSRRKLEITRMKKSVKYIALLLVFALMSGMCSCSKGDTAETSKKKKKKSTTKIETTETEETVNEIEEMLETAVPVEPIEDVKFETDLGVTADIDGSIDIPDGAELTVTKSGDTSDDAIGAHYTTYDIELGDVHELDGFVKLTIPYDPSQIPSGQDPAKCVAAMYLNETTNEWEPVIYEVDTANSNVLIFTDHFSTYGCFEFKSEGKRRAVVSDIHDYLVHDDTSMDKYLDAVKEACDNSGVPGQKCKELMRPYLEQTFNSLSEMVAQTGNTATYFTNMASAFITLTPGVESAIANNEIANGINTALGKAGLAISFLSIANTYLKEDKTDHEIITMYKDTASFMMGLSGSATLGTVCLALWFVDSAIQDMGNYAYSKVKEDLTVAYRYYMTTNNKYHGKPRTLRDWRRIIKQTAKDAALNHDNPEEAIMEEIDRYCGEFWTLSDVTLAEVYDDVGQQGRGLPDSATKQSITDEFKGELMDSLQAVFLAVQSDLEYEMWKEQQKTLEELRKILNTKITVEVKETRPADRAAHYAGYTAVFSQLNEVAIPEDWQFVLDINGSATTSVTYIGYLLVGQPRELWVYAPGQKIGVDEPEKKVEFNLIAPKTTIELELVVDEKYETGIIAGAMPDGSSMMWLSNGARITYQGELSSTDGFPYYMELRGEILTGVPFQIVASGDATVYIEGYWEDANGVQTPFSYSGELAVNQEIVIPSNAKKFVLHTHSVTCKISAFIDVVSKYSTTG